MNIADDQKSQYGPEFLTWAPVTTTNPAVPYLEHLSALLMESHTGEDTNTLLRTHLAPDFQMVNGSIHECGVPQSRNLEEHLQNVKEFRRKMPDWKVYATNVTATMGEGEHTAVVWLTVKGCRTKYDHMFNRESVSILHWRKRKRDGVWTCYRHRGIRGGGDYYE